MIAAVLTPRDETMHDEKKTEDETMLELMVIKEAGPSEMQRLTPRERGIAHLVCAGLTNKQIAQELAVTEGAIKVHLHNVYNKLASWPFAIERRWRWTQPPWT
jgi:two-component system, NarL family, nitrate/nitrite response regulator NarL